VTDSRSTDASRLAPAKIWYRAATFYDTVHYAEDDVTGEMVKVDVPSDFSFSTFADHVVIHCKSRWGPGGSLPEGVSYASGTVLAHPAAAFVRGERDAFTGAVRARERPMRVRRVLGDERLPSRARAREHGHEGVRV
jgi:hypothetical protein